MKIDAPFLRTIVEKILAVSQPEQVILFGSMVMGDASPDSDLDLLIVEESVADTRAESVRLRRALGDVGIPVNIIVISSERFRKTRDVIGGIAYPASKYGRVLYEAA